MTEAYIKLAKSYSGQLGYVNYMNKLSCVESQLWAQGGYP